MSDAAGDEVEAVVEAFVARREHDPDLTPERFVSEHPAARPEHLPALRASLDVMATLGDEVDPLPEQIGGFRVRREIGRGGMGVVYEVERDGEVLALKRLALTALLQPRALHRFEREARVLQRLAHPGIVRVRASGVADGLPYLVMELVDGPGLSAVGKLSWRRAAELVRAVADALQTVHAAGLCHRDLKPANVVVRADGTPVVVDFGLVLDGGDVTLTGTGDVVGTPRYLSPEQAEGRPADARADVHALGLLLAELLLGRPLRTATNRSDLLAMACRGVTRRQLPRLRDVPAALDRVLRTALARRPAHRYENAGAMVRDLDRLLAGRDVQCRPPGVAVRALDALRFHPRTAGVLAGAALVVAVVLGAVWLASAAAARAERARLAFEPAVLAWIADDAASAEEAATRTLAIDPSHAAALAMLRDARGRGSADASDAGALARGLAERRAGRWREAQREFAAAIAADPQCVFGRVLLAQAEEQVGHVEEADGQLTTASRLLPRSAALAAALGALRLRRADARGAALEYRRALALHPDSVDLRYRLARCLEAFDATAALQEVEAALGATPSPDGRERRNLRNLQAALLDRLGRPADAVPILEELAAAHPDDARIAFNLAYALDRLLRVREAKALYERALALDADNLNANLCLVWLQATAADPELRDPAAAERRLLDVLQRDRGRRAAVLQAVREFGLRTGRIERLLDALAQLAADESLPAQQRATLAHTRSYLENGAPPEGR